MKYTKRNYREYFTDRDGNKGKQIANLKEWASTIFIGLMLAFGLFIFYIVLACFR